MRHNSFITPYSQKGHISLTTFLFLFSPSYINVLKNILVQHKKKFFHATIKRRVDNADETALNFFYIARNKRNAFITNRIYLFIRIFTMRPLFIFCNGNTLNKKVFRADDFPPKTIPETNGRKLSV